MALEARIRGYDVTARKMNRDMMAVAGNTRLAWIDPVTGRNPEYIQSSSVISAETCFRFLTDEMQKGGRYTFEFDWREGGTGHIISAFKDDRGGVVLYDPQYDRMYKGDGAVAYLGRIDYNIYDRKGPVQLLRVDTLNINEKYFSVLVW